jgi:hypothetical protein
MLPVPTSVLTDSYKATHFLQYPTATKMVCVSRPAEPCECRREGGLHSQFLTCSPAAYCIDARTSPLSSAVWGVPTRLQ